MKLWQIWMEGWHIDPDPNPGGFIGSVEAETFQDACDKWHAENPTEFYDSKTLTWWGCRLFDNEQDARKSFG